MMNILLTNDDGIFSEGLLALANVLNKNNNVYIYAPDGNRSGASHSASFHKDFTVKAEKVGNFNAYSIGGTPADCVRFGIYHANCKIDLVVAGINHGANLGSDVVYSGTVNACLEANLFKIPAIAFSNTAFDGFNFNETTKIIENYLDALISESSCDYTLNVNVPNVLKSEINGIVFTELGVNRYTDKYIKTGDNSYRLIGDMIMPTEEDFGTDVYYSVRNYVTVTPIVHVSTDVELLKKYKDFKF